MEQTLAKEPDWQREQGIMSSGIVLICGPTSSSTSTSQSTRERMRLSSRKASRNACRQSVQAVFINGAHQQKIGALVRQPHGLQLGEIEADLRTL
jgi:hypothetical protein